MEAIILAGGFGTRLKEVIGAQPKCMAPVNGKPFLGYLFDYLDRQHCTRVIMSLGYKKNVIIDWMEEQDVYFELDYVIESEPLGTGGGILGAIEDCETDDVIVVNGDTLFDLNLREMMAYHTSKRAATTIALKDMKDFDRYGIVHTDNDGRITSFEEKKPTTQGLINGGVYIINKEAFLKKNPPEKFSFEKDYLEKYAGEQQFYGYKNESYFIDIGIPEDYEKAQADFKTLFV